MNCAQPTNFCARVCARTRQFAPSLVNRASQESFGFRCRGRERWLFAFHERDNSTENSTSRGRGERAQERAQETVFVPTRRTSPLTPSRVVPCELCTTLRGVEAHAPFSDLDVQTAIESTSYPRCHHHGDMPELCGSRGAETYAQQLHGGRDV